jgi:uncharacterized protein YukE
MGATIGTDPAAMASALSNLKAQAQQSVDALNKANQNVQQTASFALGKAFDVIRSETNADVSKAVTALTQLLDEVNSALAKVNSNVMSAVGQ